MTIHNRGAGVTVFRCGGGCYTTRMLVSAGRVGFWDGPGLMLTHQETPDLTHNPLVQAGRRGWDGF